MKCRLTRITDNGHTRTRVMEGMAPEQPTEGRPFTLFGDALDPTAGDFRLIQTTAVEKILERDEKRARFKTHNTEYVFELLDG